MNGAILTICLDSEKNEIVNNSKFIAEHYGKKDVT